ncbi:hypothetical protein [Kaistia terrae]|uniref:Pectic acid lyase n=1 Tax=Kaistia terrae TaxID=537017 RepID=A0ABW0PUD6_9HYPH|nr:hypothetical protein [Kaistia terrae]MCX5578551.1 hypothetical protein [Kaistia terrae]
MIRSPEASRRGDCLRVVRWIAILLACGAFLTRPAMAYDPALADRAKAALTQAAGVFANKLSLNGAYVWEYSPDLSVRRGEGKVGPTVGWVQPPGTPAIGAAFLRVYEVTGDAAWLKAARQAAEALIQTQLLSGGWYIAIEMDPVARRDWCYRAGGTTPEACAAIKDNPAKNETLLDDDTTQSALRFLIWLDQALDGKDEPVREAILYGMEKLSTAQYPNGAWPVRIEKRTRSDRIPKAGRASLPADWPRQWVKPSDGPYYVINDNLIRDTVHLHLIAADRFGDPAYEASAVRAGEFLLAAQLPEPQQGWAQTYDRDMRPVWGRKFEPPAVTSRESGGAATALVELYQRTGDERFLSAALGAVAWLKASQLPDGDWARFYELRTNRPLYVDSDEKLTYEPVNLLDHYSLKSTADIPEAIRLVDAAAAGKLHPFPFWPSPANRLAPAELAGRVSGLVDRIDKQGRWIEDGWIRSATFVDAVFLIARYLQEKP